MACTGVSTETLTTPGSARSSAVVRATAEGSTSTVTTSAPCASTTTAETATSLLVAGSVGSGAVGTSTGTLSPGALGGALEGAVEGAVEGEAGAPSGVSAWAGEAPTEPSTTATAAVPTTDRRRNSDADERIMRAPRDGQGIQASIGPQSAAAGDLPHPPG